MRRCRRRAAGAVVALLVAGALCGCSSSGPRSSTTSAASVDQPASGQVGIDPDPDAAELLWVPGLNASPPRTVRTPLDRQQAVDLARDVLSAGPAFTGDTNCPSDDSTAVVAHFYYSKASTKTVQFDLSGCAAVSTPGPSPRALTDALRRDLSRQAPPAWTKYLAG